MTTTNTTIQATRNIDAMDKASVRGSIAYDQSLSAPLINEQQEFDIRIKSRNAEIDRIQDEISARDKRHKEHIVALTTEHEKEIARLSSIADALKHVIKILEVGNKMLFKDNGQ